jgi:hypothetical protein
VSIMKEIDAEASTAFAPYGMPGQEVLSGGG